MKNLVLKFLDKKKYKAEVFILSDNFTAEFYSDSLNDALNWILAGLTESFATSDNYSSITRGVYGRICDFSVIHLDDNSLKLFEYRPPNKVDYMFMTDSVVFVPDSIMNQVRKETGTSTIYMSK